MSGALLLGGMAGAGQSPRRQLYAEVLSKVRVIMVSKMAKPEEVLVVETAEGEVIRETMKDTDAIEQYKVMQATLGAAPGVCARGWPLPSFAYLGRGGGARQCT